MIENRVNFVPNFAIPPFVPAVPAAAPDESDVKRRAMAVQIMDIYKAAVKRAVEDHELDKLFNPDPDDFQI